MITTAITFKKLAWNLMTLRRRSSMLTDSQLMRTMSVVNGVGPSLELPSRDAFFLWSSRVAANGFV